MADNQSWTMFISSINSYTDSRKEWTGLKKILKGYQTNPTPLASSVGDTMKELADALGKHFEHLFKHLFSSSHYTQTFLQHKKTTECQPLRLNQFSSQGYNAPLFIMPELISALSTCGKFTPGAGRISYEMIRHLPEDTLYAILSNKI